MVDLVLRKGRIVFPDGVREGDVVIQGGVIIEITSEYKGDATRTIDCQDKFIFPGVIDSHVHMRVPGALYKEDFTTGSMAGISAGVTGFLDMPNNTPPVITKKLLAEKRDLIGDNSFANYGFFFGALLRAATTNIYPSGTSITTFPGIRPNDFGSITTSSLATKSNPTAPTVSYIGSGNF